MTDKEKTTQVWTAFTVIKDGEKKGKILAPGRYDLEAGRELDPNNPKNKELVEYLTDSYWAFRIAEEQINPDRLPQASKVFRKRADVITDAIATVVVTRLFEPFKKATEKAKENGDGTTTIELDMDMPEWFDPNMTYTIDLDKAIETTKRLVREYVKIAKDEERNLDFWEYTAEWVWIHLMAHTLLGMVGEYGGWDKVGELPDLEKRFEEWLYGDEHMGPFKERWSAVVQMYIEMTAEQIAGAINEEGLILDALALKPAETKPKKNPLSDITGLVHTDHSQYNYDVKTAIAAAKDKFKGEGFPVAMDARLTVRPPYDDFNPSLLSPDELAKVQAKMWDVVYVMNDLTADLLDIITIKHLEEKKKPGEPVDLNLNDVLAMRGIQPRKNAEGRGAGYRKEDYDLIIRHLVALNHVWIDNVKREFYVIEDGNKRTKKERYYREPLVAIGGERGIRDVESGLYEQRIFDVRLARAFADTLASASPPIGLMPRVALLCHPKRHWLEKRLIRYFFHLWRARQQTASYTDPVSVGTLLDRLAVPIDHERPAKTKRRLEQALNRLSGWEDDNGEANEKMRVFESWQYIGWDDSMITRKKTGDQTWFDQWKRAYIMVEPLNIIMDYYRDRIPDKPNEEKRPKGKQVHDIGRAIHDKRTREGLSMSQLAEMLGVAPSQISRWEAGQTKPRGKALKKVQEWLEETPKKSD